MMRMWRKSEVPEPTITYVVPHDPENLKWLISEARFEYKLRIGTYKSLDVQLGVLIAFVGLLLAFGSQVPVLVGIFGSCWLIVAGFIAVMEFSPKSVPILNSLYLLNAYGDGDLQILQNQTLGLLHEGLKDLKSKNSEKADKLNLSGFITLVVAISYGIALMLK